jgi:cell division protein FtsQ
MGFGRAKNRRRADEAERTASLRVSAARTGRALARWTLALALLGGGLYGGRALLRWATTSPTLALRAVTFSGLERASVDELQRLGGLVRGTNLVRLDPAATARLLEGHPWVRDAEVTRHFPATVAVTIAEHVPAAVASMGELYVVDAQGQPFKRLQANDTLDLPRVTGVTREDYLADAQAAAARVGRALEVARAYAELQPAGPDELSELRTTAAGITLVTSSGAQIHLGAEDPAAALRRLGRVRNELRRRGLTAEAIHLDNRVRPSWVTVKVLAPSSERRREVLQ